MSEYDDLVEGFDGITSHGMTVGDQSTADALDEILGAPSSDEGERRGDNAEVAGSTPAGPISDGEVAVEEIPVNPTSDEPPHFDDDWPEPEPPVPLYAEDVDTVPPADLRVLKPDQRPKIGQHYVVFGGIPKPVVRDNFGATEDEFVRSQIDESDSLKDPDGQRRVRADRALRQRYRGYVCGEMSSL